ncbi:unnamed protein product [Prorocentrum cordatum]|uniref:Aurora kinase n=1 Tax=Prorocentrum cordatum TaxID=2364126 RepID=A0ABN9QWM0_9DINO|nr:unnamed protein product [Polarella glacialis]
MTGPGVPQSALLRRSSIPPQREDFELDDFEAVGKALGRGAFGYVSKVKQKHTGKIFAMKVMSKTKIEEQSLEENIEREISTQQTLGHPNILRLYKYFEDQEDIHLLLEYAPNGSLFDLLRDHRKAAAASGEACQGLPEDRAACMFGDVAGALHFLHCNGVVHRDLKPENILICEDDVVKLADFGWCNQLAAEYLSPEMINSEPHDCSVDAWASGVLLFEMLVGRSPFAASSYVQALGRISRVAYEFPDHVSAPARDLVGRLLVKEPGQRLGLGQAAEHPWVRDEDEDEGDGEDEGEGEGNDGDLDADADADADDAAGRRGGGAPRGAEASGREAAEARGGEARAGPGEGARAAAGEAQGGSSPEGAAEDTGCPSCTCGGQTSPAESSAAPSAILCLWSTWLALGVLIGVVFSWLAIFLLGVARGCAARALGVFSSSPPTAAAMPNSLQTYGFDPVPRADILALKRQTAVQAAILGDDGQDVEMENFGWVVSETSHLRFGQILTDPEVEQATLGQNKGVAIVSDLEVFVEKVQVGQLEAWKTARHAGAGDLRLLGDHRDASGRRHLALAEAVAMMRETDCDDWVSPDPRVAKEWLVSIRDGPGDATSCHGPWVRRSGVSESSAVAHIHYVLCEAARLAMQTDQLDVTNLSSFELIMRRICQDETAVARNPRHPDYGGLEIVLHAPTTEQGQASTSKFTEWVTGRLKEQAAIYKQTRLWNEEQRALQPARGSSDTDKGPGRKGNRARGKGDKSARGDRGSGTVYSLEALETDSILDSIVERVDAVGNLAPFDLTKLKFAKGRARPRSVANSLPPLAAEMIRNPAQYIEKDEGGDGVHARVDRSGLGSAGALADLDFSIGGGSFDGVDSIVGWDPRGNEADVEDCFYNFAIDGLAERFGFDDPLPVVTIRDI